MKHIAMLLVLAACSSKAQQKAGPCTPRQGSYLFHADQASGDCGQPSDQVLVFDEKTQMAVAACSGSATQSQDLCAVTMDTVCPAEGVCKGCKTSNTGKVNWDPNGDTGSGVLQIVGMNPNGTTACSSTYNVRYTKL